jgi:hypothetical protein
VGGAAVVVVTSSTIDLMLSSGWRVTIPREAATTAPTAPREATQAARGSVMGGAPAERAAAHFASSEDTMRRRPRVLREWEWWLLTLQHEHGDDEGDGGAETESLEDLHGTWYAICFRREEQSERK